MRSVLDVFIHGANVTARLSEKRTACVLRDLGLAVADLAQKKRGKVIVRFYDEPWEMCIERLGHSAALSVYRSGAEPEIGVYDVRVPFEDVALGVRDAIRACEAPQPIALELEGALALLDRPIVQADEDEQDPPPVSVETDEGAPISMGTEFLLRSAGSAPTNVERTDLHALLFRGRVRAEVRSKAIDLGDAHPFLFAERFLDLASRALASWERGRSMAVRREGGGIMIGLRIGMGGTVALSLGQKRAEYTFPALDVSDVVHAALAFGRSLVRAILRRDRSQGNNLRLSAFRRQLRETQSALREAARDDAIVNPAPESYRAFAESVRPPSVTENPPRRLRYAPRWRAIVPGIDLKATFLCGDRLIVGGAAETFCLERTTGQPIWRIETRRATCVPTPLGLARIHADGELRLHDLGDGRALLRTRLEPRAFGPPAGAVVHAPTLPRLLIVTEGERHLVAIDLSSGEPRWRFVWGNGGALRLRRSGKLLYIASGEATLTAVDVTNGEMVWRARDRLRFRGAPTLEHDELYAIAGGSAGATHLHALCAFSGSSRWVAAVPEEGRSCTVEGAPLVSGRVVIVCVRERHGVVLRAYDRESGKLAWTTPSAVAPVGTSWLALEGLVVGNAPTGEIVGIGAETGRTLYRHVLGRVLEADVPRKLDPVLRSGALYVPHVDVHVFRPSDGAHLCTIGPCDAIPDLMRVDEKCDVYVAEESGHLASFGAGPRLELVR